MDRIDYQNPAIIAFLGLFRNATVTTVSYPTQMLKTLQQTTHKSALEILRQQPLRDYWIGFFPHLKRTCLNGIIVWPLATKTQEHLMAAGLDPVTSKFTTGVIAGSVSAAMTYKLDRLCILSIAEKAKCANHASKYTMMLPLKLITQWPSFLVYEYYLRRAAMEDEQTKELCFYTQGIMAAKTSALSICLAAPFDYLNTRYYSQGQKITGSLLLKNAFRGVPANIIGSYMNTLPSIYLLHLFYCSQKDLAL